MARHKIPEDRDKGRKIALDVILDDEDENVFDVIPESVPEGLRDTLEDGTPIRWVSNFRVAKKPGKAKTGKKVKYSIELEGVSGDLYYYDESSKKPIRLEKRDAGNDRVQADLTVDDPPIGHT
jgi:hypothetical protein